MGEPAYDPNHTPTPAETADPASPYYYALKPGETRNADGSISTPDSRAQAQLEADNHPDDPNFVGSKAWQAQQAAAAQAAAAKANTDRINNSYEYGGTPGGAAASSNYFNGQAIGDATRPGAQIDYTNANGDRANNLQDRAGQQKVADAITARALGTAPTIASLQGAIDQQKVLAAQSSAAASARGPAALALAQQNAAANTAAGQSTIANSTEINSANEKRADESAAFGAQTGIRTGDQSLQGQDATQGIAQGQIDQNQNALNDAAANNNYNRAIGINEFQSGAQQNRVAAENGAYFAGQNLLNQQHASGRADLQEGLQIGGTAAAIAGGTLTAIGTITGGSSKAPGAPTNSGGANNPNGGGEDPGAGGYDGNNVADGSLDPGTSGGSYGGGTYGDTPAGGGNGGGTSGGVPNFDSRDTPKTIGGSFGYGGYDPYGKTTTTATISAPSTTGGGSTTPPAAPTLGSVGFGSSTGTTATRKPVITSDLRIKDGIVSEGHPLEGGAPISDAAAARLSAQGDAMMQGTRAQTQGHLAQGPAVGSPARPRMSDAEAARLSAAGDRISQGTEAQSRAQLAQAPATGGHPLEQTAQPTNRVDAFLDGIHPLSYHYKDAGAEPRSTPTGGRYLGISAQDLEAVPEVGHQMVSEGPRGKQIESGPTLSAALAGLARLHERVKDLEAPSPQREAMLTAPPAVSESRRESLMNASGPIQHGGYFARQNLLQQQHDSGREDLRQGMDIAGAGANGLATLGSIMHRHADSGERGGGSNNEDLGPGGRSNRVEPDYNFQAYPSPLNVRYAHDSDRTGAPISAGTEAYMRDQGQWGANTDALLARGGYGKHGVDAITSDLDAKGNIVSEGRPLVTSSAARKATPGAIEEGNINHYGRPEVQNADGSVSTVRSMSFNDGDGREVLVPTAYDGAVHSDKESVDHYRQTGQHMGVFKTPEQATAYAEKVHDDYEGGRYKDVGHVLEQRERRPVNAITSDIRAKEDVTPEGSLANQTKTIAAKREAFQEGVDAHAHDAGLPSYMFEQPRGASPGGHAASGSYARRDAAPQHAEVLRREIQGDEGRRNISDGLQTMTVPIAPGGPAFGAGQVIMGARQAYQANGPNQAPMPVPPVRGAPPIRRDTATGLPMAGQPAAPTLGSLYGGR